jgi:peptide chain release factor 1
MFENLVTLSKRFDELTVDVNDPAKMTQGTEYARIVRERGQIEPIVVAFRAYQQAEADLRDAKEMGKAGGAEASGFAEMIPELEEDLARKLEELKDTIARDDPDADRACIVEIRAGAGGEEAALFARDLFTMYSRYGQTRRWKVDVLTAKEADAGGYKEVTFSVTGANAFRYMRTEGGGHRVQRVPATESQGRIHTSAVTLAALPEAEAVEVDLRESDIDFTAVRASGPGGQNVNKVSSAVRLVHRPSGLVVECQEERSQHKNRDKAMRMLAAKLYDAQLAAKNAARNAARSVQIGSGDRSERIRTYNYPQNRVTDHRSGDSFSLEHIMLGEIQPMLDAVQEWVKEEKLRQV